MSRVGCRHGRAGPSCRRASIRAARSAGARARRGAWVGPAMMTAPMAETRAPERQPGDRDAGCRCADRRGVGVRRERRRAGRGSRSRDPLGAAPRRAGRRGSSRGRRAAPGRSVSCGIERSADSSEDGRLGQPRRPQRRRGPGPAPTTCAAHSGHCREVLGGAGVRAGGELAVDVGGDGLRREVVLPPVRERSPRSANARQPLATPSSSCTVGDPPRGRRRRRSSELRSAARPRWILLLTVPSFTPSVAPISSYDRPSTSQSTTAARNSGRQLVERGLQHAGRGGCRRRPARAPGPSPR